jgi:hypothetical protein
MRTNTPSVLIYNTFTRAKEELQPVREGMVKIYSCGPTVYRFVHVGNLRTFMLPDLLCRSLEYLGYKTEQVMNITDVGHLTDDTFDRGEDKMLVSARLENKSPAEIAAYYTAAFMHDAAKLNIRRAARYPHATHYIPQMINLITKLIARRHAYDVGGTVYFDIDSFPAYGKLSRNTTDKLSPVHAARSIRESVILATSHSGRRRGNTGFRFGPARGVQAFPAGISNARRCRCRSWAIGSTFTQGAPTTSFPTMRRRLRKARASPAIVW